MTECDSPIQFTVPTTDDIPCVEDVLSVHVDTLPVLRACQEKEREGEGEGSQGWRVAVQSLLSSPSTSWLWRRGTTGIPDSVDMVCVVDGPSGVERQRGGVPDLSCVPALAPSAPDYPCIYIPILISHDVQSLMSLLAPTLSHAVETQKMVVINAGGILCGSLSHLKDMGCVLPVPCYRSHTSLVTYHSSAFPPMVEIEEWLEYSQH
ncbi:hypothetical protein KIPB_008542 [Kipferlia bialata]|uniref:Uncharacterized protein n=1 Tax=Kipferlia bialata TaxID=797122 RepID=A0A9K3D084_9EUKA|nr:hypothetical protein KIPB_008542 [Kipferlia bialata]|eukprot:g8542.t1